MSLSSVQFIDLLQSHLADLGDRRVRYQGQSLGEHGMVYVTLINLPKALSSPGAEAENNRVSVAIIGFDRHDPNAPAPGKVKAELSVSALPRETRMRAKSGTPASVAKYVADYFKKIVRDVPPKFTHSALHGLVGYRPS